MIQSRTKNVLKNISFGLICQIVSLLFAFASRTLFIHFLDIEYLGINGLFSNILKVLSFAELGIGNAIIFSLYKPLAIGDEKKTSSLMCFFKSVYTILGIIIISLGFCLIPFLNIIINTPPDIPENLTVLYVLFLLNSGLSYFFSYKKTLLIADQKNYIVATIEQIVNIVHFLANVGILYYTRNFFLYLLFNIFFTLVDNIVASHVVSKKYSFLKQNIVPLGRKEKKKIFENVKSLAVYKFGSVIVNGTDNIFISALVGVSQVGLVSNYVLVTNACNSILAKIEDSFMSSIGNLNALSDKERKYSVFQKTFFITFWIYGFAFCGLSLLLNDFISIWLGSQYCLSQSIVFAICLELYVSGIHNPAYMYRTTLGFFKQGQWSAIYASILNIGLSLLLFKLIGLSGIFFATSVAKFFSYGIVDPMLIYKNAFERKVSLYYFKYSAYALLLAFAYIILYFTLQNLCCNSLGDFALKVIIVCVIYNTILFIVFRKSLMFKELITQLKQILSHK